MSKHQHRPGVSEASLVKRYLKLLNLDKVNPNILVADLDQVCGIDHVSLDIELSMIQLEYDASQCQLGELESIMQDHGVEVDPGWWNKFKEEYYHFVDQNGKDNAQHTPLSCHHAPPLAKPRKKSK